MLKRILQNRRRKKYYQFLRAELDGSLLALDHFLTRMRQERLRSERSGSPLSLLVIDSAGMVDFLAENNSVSPRRFTKHIGSILKNSTRESDVKGWYEENKVALLTPDTNEAGTRILATKLTQKILDYNGNKHDFQEDDLRRFINISSLQIDGSYLANGKGGNGTGQKQVRPASPSPYYHFDFSLSQPDENPSLPSARAVELAVIEWPFTFEIMNQAQLQDLQLEIKRIVDIIGSIIGIVLCAPLMLAIAAAIKLTSPGPVLFRQERLGFLGKPFTFLKFRSMKADSDPSIHQEYVKKLINGQTEEINKGTAEKPLYKLTEDPRITPLGKFLRKSSLDELPQLFIVLKGDMSLVGPRPPIPYECDAYKRWHCRRVLEVKPGITGLWQVSGRSSTTFEEMVRLDLAYVRNWSLWLDLKIILKTFWAVVSTKGGY